MRVLIVSKLDRQRSYGGSNRAFHLGRALARKAEVSHVAPDCAHAAGGPHRSLGALGLADFVRGVRAALADVRPDVVLSLESRANLACRLLRAAGHRFRWVTGFDSSPAFEWRHYLGRADVPRGRALARYAAARAIERTILSGAAPVVVVSTGLAGLVRDWYGVAPARLHVVPNGAPDEMLTRPAWTGPSPYAALGDGARVALLIAPRNFHSNVLAARFAHDVARRLERREAALRVVLVGGGPVLGEQPNVRYAGYVDDVVPWIDAATVCLLPYPPDAVCGGARLKAMEYLARGKAVVATGEGLRGVDGVRDGVEALVAGDTPEAFAARLAPLLHDARTRARLGEAGRRLVRERYEWSALAARLLTVLEAAA
jgi:glycosyltransferase involved in cell wall biosynthesis